MCYANEGDSQKERERTWRPLLLPGCTDTAAMHLLVHPPARQKRALWIRGCGGDAAWHFPSYFMLNRPQHWTFKVFTKRSDLRNALYLEECILRTSPDSVNSFQPTKHKQNLNRITKKTDVNTESRPSSIENCAQHHYSSRQVLRESPTFKRQSGKHEDSPK